MKSLKCGAKQNPPDATHLECCHGLTLQEYALRHGLPLEAVVPMELCDCEDSVETWAHGTATHDRRSRFTYEALRCAGVIETDERWERIPGRIRTLDALLWLRDRLEPLGFAYRQEYTTAGGSHRMVARNHIKRPCADVAHLAFADLSEAERREYVAIFLTHAALRRAGYVFVQAPESADQKALICWLTDAMQIEFRALDSLDGRCFLRTATENDARRLVEGLLPELRQIPYQEERLYQEGVKATIVKEQGIDAAHFITDHSGACANLHGGHYSVRFKIHDRIDPTTGFVMDYTDLKQLVRARIVNVLDHHTLNYAAPELTWRSSTEFLAVWMWEQLIEYLPSLQELEIHETESSYCQYRGPTLEEYLQNGPQMLLRHFQDSALGQERQNTGDRPALRVVRASG